MPVRRGQTAGSPYYAWGRRGARYYYVAGDAPSRARARLQAERQGRAIKARGGAFRDLFPSLAEIRGKQARQDARRRARGSR